MNRQVLDETAPFAREHADVVLNRAREGSAARIVGIQTQPHDVGSLTLEAMREHVRDAESRLQAVEQSRNELRRQLVAARKQVVEMRTLAATLLLERNAALSEVEKLQKVKANA